MRTVLTSGWVRCGLPKNPDYDLVALLYGKAGIFKSDQTIEAVSFNRMRGFVAVVCGQDFCRARLVTQKLNTLECSAVCPSDYGAYFPWSAEHEAQKAKFWGAILDASAELVVVPFPNWEKDSTVWTAVRDALHVNKRVSVLLPEVMR